MIPFNSDRFLYSPDVSDHKTISGAPCIARPDFIVTKVISAGVATVSSSNFNPFDFIVSLLYFYRRFAVALDKSFISSITICDSTLPFTSIGIVTLISDCLQLRRKQQAPQTKPA